MKIFLTGGTGFIGSHFVNEAHSAGHEIIGLRRTVSSTPRIELIKQPLWINKAQNQISQEDLEGCEALVHLAAHSVLHPHDTIENCVQENVLAPLELFRTAIAAGIRRFFVAGSYFEYGLSSDRYEYLPVDAPLEPNSGYSASKAAASLVFHALACEENVQLLILRIFQAYGEGEASNRFWPSLCRAALAGEDFAMTEGTQVRDFIAVKDVASAFVSALDRTDIPNGRPVINNLGTGHAQTLASFARKEWERLGATGRLLVGAVPMRKTEVKRCVAFITETADTRTSA